MFQAFFAELFFQLSFVFADCGQTPGVHAQLPELPGSHPHKNAKNCGFVSLALPSLVFPSGPSRHRFYPADAQLGANNV